MTDTDTFAPDPRGFFTRVVHRLFPFKFEDWPDWIFETGNGLCTDVTVHFSWPDRLRILFGGRLFVETRTATTYEPGPSKSHSRIYVQEPRWAQKAKTAREKGP